MDRLNVIYYLEQIKRPIHEKALRLMGMGNDAANYLVSQAQALDSAISDVTCLEEMKENALTIERAKENAAALHSLQEKVITLQAVAGLTIEDLTARIKAERRMQMRRPPVTDRPAPGENHD